MSTTSANGRSDSQVSVLPASELTEVAVAAKQRTIDQLKAAEGGKARARASLQAKLTDVKAKLSPGERAALEQLLGSGGRRPGTGAPVSTDERSDPHLKPMQRPEEDVHLKPMQRQEEDVHLKPMQRQEEDVHLKPMQRQEEDVHLKPMQRQEEDVHLKPMQRQEP
jgi:hypothetical protein